MTRPTPRRPATSRGGTQRPRKIAGQASPVPVAEPATESDVEPRVEPDVEPDVAPEVEPEAAEAPDEQRPEAGSPARAGSRTDDGRPGVLARQKTTRVLIAVLVLVALALGIECAMLVVDRVRDDDSAQAVDGRDAVNEVSVPADRPVVATDLDVKAGVDAAAKAAQEIVAVDFQKYDDEVTKAADLMTARFADSYRKLAGEVQKDFVANKTVVQATVVAQGVAKASRTRLQALVFLNQFVQRTRDGKPETVVTPYRVLVTMVHTDQGWLVDGLATDVKEGTDSGE